MTGPDDGSPFSVEDEGRSLTVISPPGADITHGDISAHAHVVPLAVGECHYHLISFVLHVMTLEVVAQLVVNGRRYFQCIDEQQV